MQASGILMGLRALTANVGVLRTASALTGVNDGHPISTTDAAPQEFFVDSGDGLTLHLYGAGSGTLRVYWD